MSKGSSSVPTPGFDLKDVAVRVARCDEVPKWNELMNENHYLGFKQFAGRGLRCVGDTRCCPGLVASASGSRVRKAAFS